MFKITKTVRVKTLRLCLDNFVYLEFVNVKLSLCFFNGASRIEYVLG
jgi:hypothetical protein